MNKDKPSDAGYKPSDAGDVKDWWEQQAVRDAALRKMFIRDWRNYGPGGYQSVDPLPVSGKDSGYE